MRDSSCYALRAGLFPVAFLFPSMALDTREVHPGPLVLLDGDSAVSRHCVVVGVRVVAEGWPPV